MAQLRNDRRIGILLFNWGFEDDFITEQYDLHQPERHPSNSVPKHFYNPRIRIRRHVKLREQQCTPEKVKTSLSNRRRTENSSNAVPGTQLPRLKRACNMSRESRFWMQRTVAPRILRRIEADWGFQSWGANEPVNERSKRWDSVQQHQESNIENAKIRKWGEKHSMWFHSTETNFTLFHLAAKKRKQILDVLDKDSLCLAREPSQKVQFWHCVRLPRAQSGAQLT